jgi:thymidylate synthase (FAD)
LVSYTQPVIDGINTPDELVAYVARVSNPNNQLNTKTGSSLIKYLIDHQHWSPLQMVDVTLEITTTRDIGRQILRHRSFEFQEFCVSGDTLISLELPSHSNATRKHYSRTIEHLYKLQSDNRPLPSGIRVFDENTKTFIVVPIKEIFQTGIKPVYEIILENGKHIKCTKEHKFLTSVGFDSLENLVNLSITSNNTATYSNIDTVLIGCNGTETHKNYTWMELAKQRAIKSGGGLSQIAEEAGCSYHTIRKWLKKHGLSFTKKEVSSYTSSWNTGLNYSWGHHSLSTIKKMRLSAKRGKNSNLWRGGVTRSERLKIADWANSIRSEILMNFDYKCKNCGDNKNLHLHHILPVYSHPELAYDKNNLEVLCKVCHEVTHNINGDRKVWKTVGEGNTLTTRWSKIRTITYIGMEMTYDLEVEHTSHNYVANGIVVHNSQRYADPTNHLAFEYREARLQDNTNRQNSLKTTDDELQRVWTEKQRWILGAVNETYRWALDNNIAKEVARAVLPEGMTESRIYMKGSLRSWIHYCNLRIGPETQKEHREVAEACWKIIETFIPSLTRGIK